MGISPKVSLERERKNRNGKIDLMRFLMSVVVVLHHSRYLVGDENCRFLGGSFAVEFFFIVSGFLMAKTVYGNTANHREKSTGEFLKGKLSSLYPELLVAWVIGWGFISFAKHAGIRGSIKLALNGFWDLILLFMTGLHPEIINGPTWYLSSMLICMVFLYPLLKKYKDKKYLFFFIAVMVAGYLYKAWGSPRAPNKWLGLTFKGNLRALFELCLGIVCYYAYEKISSWDLTKFGKVFFTALEWGCYGIVFAYMFRGVGGTRWDYILIVVLIIAITLSFSHKSISADWFDNGVCWFLGKYSFPLFLSHFYFAKYLGNLLPSNWSIAKQTTIYMLISLLNAFLVMGISTYLRKHSSAISGAVKRLMIKEEAVSSPASNR